MNTEPKSNVAEYEIIDDERILVKKFGNKQKIEMKHIYHIGTGGILCNDFETYVDFNDAVEVEFSEEA